MNITIASSGTSLEPTGSPFGPGPDDAIAFIANQVKTTPINAATAIRTRRALVSRRSVSMMRGHVPTWPVASGSGYKGECVGAGGTDREPERELTARAYEVVRAPRREPRRIPAEVAILERVDAEPRRELDADGLEPEHDRDPLVGRYDPIGDR